MFDSQIALWSELNKYLNAQKFYELFTTQIAQQNTIVILIMTFWCWFDVETDKITLLIQGYILCFVFFSLMQSGQKGFNCCHIHHGSLEWASISKFYYVQLSSSEP